MKGGRLIWQGPVADFAARSLDAPTGGPEAVLAARLEDAYICLTGAGFDVHD
jgi:hypothetical protein